MAKKSNVKFMGNGVSMSHSDEAICNVDLYIISSFLYLGLLYGGLFFVTLSTHIKITKENIKIVNVHTEKRVILTF